VENVFSCRFIKRQLICSHSLQGDRWECCELSSGGTHVCTSVFAFRRDMWGSFVGSFRKSVMMKRDFGTVCPSSLTCVRLSVCSAALSCNVQRAAPQQAGADCRNTLVFLE